MKRKDLKKKRQARRKVAVKNNLTFTDGIPRLTVTKSNVHIYAQIIDDQNRVTKVSASTIDKENNSQLDTMNKVDQSKTVGKLLAERAKAANINKVVFDRNGFLYTGRIKALADAAREAGLEF